MSLKRMPLKTLKALIEVQYIYLTLCISAHEQTQEPQKQMFLDAGLLAKEQLKTLTTEYTRRNHDADILIDTFHQKLNSTITTTYNEEHSTNA